MARPLPASWTKRIESKTGTVGATSGGGGARPKTKEAKAGPPTSCLWEELIYYKIENPVNLWLKLSLRPSTQIQNEFLEYWRIMVPRILAPSVGETSLTQQFDENRVNKDLLSPLESYICGGVGCEVPIFKILSQNDSPTGVCGKVFGPNEPVYSCRDCGQDLGRVLCTECFKHSEHRNHQYKVMTSDGGGYCDCGDTEAFKRHTWCSLHALDPNNPNQRHISSTEVLSTFPYDIGMRARRMIYEIIQYIFIVTSRQKKVEELLVGFKEKEQWPELKLCFDSNNYCLLALNDDIHSNQQVLGVVMAALGKNCSQKQAQDLTHFIDKEGRSVLKVGTYQACVNMRERLEHSSSLTNAIPVPLTILPSYLVAHQVFAIKLLKWLIRLFQKCSGFRALFANIILSNNEEDKITVPGCEDKLTVAKAIILNDNIHWKELRKAWMKVLIEGVLKDYDFKLKFSRILANAYKDMMDRYIVDRQEGDTAIMNLTVQLFSVKSIAHILLEEENVLAKVVDFYRDLVKRQYADGLKPKRISVAPRTLEAWYSEDRIAYLKAETCLADMMYILRSPFEEKEMTKGVRKSFENGVKKYVELIGFLQNSDKFLHKKGEHVEFEPREWEFVGKMVASLAGVASQIHRWCAKDKEILVSTTNTVLMEIVKCNEKSDVDLVRRLCEISDRRLSYEITSANIYMREVSVNVPYQRFLAGLLPLFNNFTPEFAGKLRHRVDQYGDILQIVDPALTAVSVLASISSGLWRRNGMPVMGRDYLYQHFHMCPSLKRNDLILLQSAACLMDDPGRLVMAILQRYKLLTWANGKMDDHLRCEETMNKKKLSEETIEETSKMGEACLNLLIAIVMERHVHAIGKISDRQELKHRLIQLLCCDEMPHSKVITALEVGQEDVPNVDQVLMEVAVLKQSTKEKGRRVYEVKPEFVGQFNPFYYYFTQEQHSKAWKRQHDLKKKLGKRPICPPPPLPPLRPIYFRLTKIVQSTPVIQLIVSTLKRTMFQTKLLTTKMLIQVCYLIIQGYQDDIMTHDSDFANFAEEIELVTGLKVALGCVNKEVDMKEVEEVLTYTIDRVNEARELILNIYRYSNREGQHQHPTDLMSQVSVESDADAAERKRKQEAAALRRQQLMSQMSRQQDQFANKNAKALDDVDLVELVQQEQSHMSDAKVSKSQQSAGHVDPVAVGPKRTCPTVADPKYTCILCQEASTSLEADGVENAFVMAAYVQVSTVMNKSKGGDGVCRDKCNEDTLPADLSCGPLITSCGHPMHSACFQKYFDSLVRKEREMTQNVSYRQILNYDVNKSEYLCPICEKLCATSLPLMPSVTKFVQGWAYLGPNEDTFAKWINMMEAWSTDKTTERPPPYVIPSQSKLVLPRLVPKKRSVTSRQEQVKIPTDILNMAGVFTLSMMSRSLGMELIEGDFRAYQLCYQACSMTIQWSQAHRIGQRIIEGISEREEDTLRSLVRLSVLYPLGAAKNAKGFKDSSLKFLKANALFSLSAIFLNDQEKSFHELDALTLLIIMTVAVPTLTGNGKLEVGKQDHYIVLLCFLVHLTQTLIGFKDFDESTMKDLPPSWIEEEKVMTRIFRKVVSQPNLKDVTATNCGGTPGNLASKLKFKMLRFLRCASVFYHYYTDIPLPRLEGFSELCRYLGMPENLQQIIDHPGARIVIDRLLSYSLPAPKKAKTEPEGAAALPAEASLSFTPCDMPANLRPLLQLPKEYTSLLDRLATFKCKNNVTGDCNNPTMCLVCGEILCSQSICCETKIAGKKMGACMSHLKSCGGNSSVFLILKECRILILSSLNRGAYLPAPYIDAYGECDEGLRRGNPLHLDPEMYDDLQKMWILSDIPDRISRTFDPEAPIYKKINWAAF